MNYFPQDELNGLECLSVWQPWVWCMFFLPPHQRKDVENRTWFPGKDVLKPGDLLAIHAGKSTEEFDACVELIQNEFGITVPEMEDLPFGAIVGVVRFVGASRGHRSRWAAGGQVQWEIADPRPLQTPVTYRGLQGLFKLNLTPSLFGVNRRVNATPLMRQGSLL